MSAFRGRPAPTDHHAIAPAAATAGSTTIAAVSFVAIASPAATPVIAAHATPPPVATRPTPITKASAKQANSASWMYIRE